MTLENKWKLAVEAAALLVESYRLPKGAELYAFDFGASQSDTSSSFSRKGTSAVERQYTLPPNIQSLINGQADTSAIPSTLGNAESNALLTLLQQLSSDVPGVAALQEAENIDPTVFQGLSSLLQMTQRNPYSSDYESAIGGMYDRMFEKGRALAQSGPTNVRGGQARTGFELGELDAQIGMNKFRDVRQQQDREASTVGNAVNILNTIESMRRGSRIQAQGQHTQGEHTRAAETLGATDSLTRRRGAGNSALTLATEALGTPKQTTTDNLKGKGNQSNTSFSVGGSINPCCFIFLQALNGKLPYYVRRGRDDYNTPNRRAGYVSMSRWLVPWMRKSKWVAGAVNTLMVKPFIWWGRSLYDRTGMGWVMRPYCWAWFYLWSLIGKVYGR